MPPEAKPPRELRLAVVMTGGVSLAIWMGGVASEIDQLVRTKRTKAKDRTPQQAVYDELLTLAGYTPRVDVVSGTSAGGVNGALLAGAVARRRKLDGLRDIWLKVADFEELLRSPYTKDQPSVLKGDEYFTPGLRKGFKTLLGDGTVEPKADDHPVELLVTTTLLNGEDSRLVDHFGTQIPDVRHNGLFKFDRTQLMGNPKVVSELALAARSSASFPVAFEPSWVPCNPDDADPAHPSMKGIADFHANHFVIDGGVLMNRPLDPALRAMFAMPADTEDVTRVLLYVVPDPGESVEPEKEQFTSPVALTDVALRSLVTIPRTQSIAGDLEGLNKHNARVEAQRDARAVLLTRWFPPDVDDLNDLVDDYSQRRAGREVDWLLSELTLRWPDSMIEELDFKPLDREKLRGQLVTSHRQQLPDELPPPEPDATDVGAWGVDSIERAATVTLDLITRGRAAAEPGSQPHRALNKARKRTHDALETLRERRRARRAKLRDREDGEKQLAWATAMFKMLREDDDEVLAAGLTVGRALRDAATAIGELPDGELPTMTRRLVPDVDASEGECLRRLFALEVVQDAVGLTTPVVEQTIQLLQVSANTRDGISQNETAAEKLTGMRLAHFAAFYKPSWRANDWMWGRLDAAGWLAQLLLKPSRLELAFGHDAGSSAAAMKRIREIALGPEGDEHDWLRAQLDGDKAEMKKELAWLDKPAESHPASLPVCSLAVARRIQLSILAEELPGVAQAVRLDEARQALSQSGRNFQAVWEGMADVPQPGAAQAGAAGLRVRRRGLQGRVRLGPARPQRERRRRDDDLGAGRQPVGAAGRHPQEPDHELVPRPRPGAARDPRRGAAGLADRLRADHHPDGDGRRSPGRRDRRGRLPAGADQPRLHDPARRLARRAVAAQALAAQRAGHGWCGAREPGHLADSAARDVHPRVRRRGLLVRRPRGLRPQPRARVHRARSGRRRGAVRLAGDRAAGRRGAAGARVRAAASW